MNILTSRRIRLKWQRRDAAATLSLPRLPKGDKSKEALARQLRQETTMSLKWITQRLFLGSWSNVVNLLRKSKSAKSENWQMARNKAISRTPTA
jgi:hypothetical protein